MAGRLRGGPSRPRPPPVPGSWHCHVCDMGGCWPARNTCFRCLAPRGTVPQPQSRSEPPRENQFPVQSPQPSGGVNPTYRKLAPQAASVPPTGGNLDAAVKGMLWSRRCVDLGCLRVFWSRCQDSEPGKAWFPMVRSSRRPGSHIFLRFRSAAAALRRGRLRRGAEADSRGRPGTCQFPRLWLILRLFVLFWLRFPSSSAVARSMLVLLVCSWRCVPFYCREA